MGVNVSLCECMYVSLSVCVCIYNSFFSFFSVTLAECIILKDLQDTLLTSVSLFILPRRVSHPGDFLSRRAS